MSLGRTRGVFERDVLPGYLARTRWYPERSPRAIMPRLTSAIPVCIEGDNRPWLVFFQATQRGVSGRYALPMQIDWVRFDRERYNPRAFAAVRQGSREGTLLDVATDPGFVELLLQCLRDSLVVNENGMRLSYLPTARLADMPDTPPQHIRAVETEQSNSTALVDSDYVVKLYRKLENGLNPEIEIGRFLTDVAGFANTPALLGSVEYHDGETTSAVAVVHAFVENQGDGWTVTSAYLDRYLDEQRLLTGTENPGESEEQIPYLRYMAQTGKRLAELHLALACHDHIAEFAPEPITPDRVDAWVADVGLYAERVIEDLRQRRDQLRESDRSLIDQLLALREQIAPRLASLFPRNSAGMNIRHHGDFHLGQMLIVKEDIFIIDFEGEPRRSLDERRRKAPAARDVAGLLRSIDYSAIAALERALKTAPEEHSKLANALESWRARASAALLAAYREAMADMRLWPSHSHAADGILDFFLLEKALYEIEYELAHRPDWLRVPLAGVVRILTPRTEETP
jgi:maltose alpha-D-glucosyltransferase/alpha-amylase